MTAAATGRPLRHELSERDFAIVQVVAEHRFLTARQVEGLLFYEHSSPLAAARVCRRVLARLTRERLLVRLKRRVGGVRAGSASFVYALGVLGGLLLSGTRNRVTEPSPLFLDHTLAIGDARLVLEIAAREGLFDLAEIEIEPTSWRRFSGPGGTSSFVKPDMYVVTGRAEFEDCWFIEIDRGTESPAAISRKCRAYDLYWRSGLEQTAHGTYPLVLWVAPDERRAGRLAAVVNRARNLNRELFRVTTTERLIETVAGGAA
jgi:hypothetical protein